MIVFALSILAIIASIAIAGTVFVRLPADYFGRVDAVAATTRGVTSRARIIAKNALGVVLVVIGVMLAIPGVPGQGLLTAAAGLLLLDFPGARRVLTKIVGQPPLLSAVNRLRQRFSRPPLYIR